jgi:hypothetical protein
VVALALGGCIGVGRVKDFFYNIYSHKEKKIQCRYESPREEAREGHDYLVFKKENRVSASSGIAKRGVKEC